MAVALGEKRGVVSREALRAAAARYHAKQAAVLEDICAEMTPADQRRFLVGIGACLGSAVESAKTEAALRRTTERLISNGYHVEAASILLSNGMKREALSAVAIGLSHHHADNRADFRVRVRLVELERMSKMLP